MSIAILVVAGLGAMGTIYLVSIERARRRDEVRARQRAEVTARCVITKVHVGDGRVDEYYLEVENRGLGDAHDVDLVTFASQQEGRSVLDRLVHREAVFPIQSLRPSESVSVPMTLTIGSPAAPWRAELRWVDGTGPRTETVVVTARR